MARIQFPNSQLQCFPSLIMPDEVLNDLATWAERITDKASMRRWVGSRWSDLGRYWTDILQIIQHGQAMRLDEGEIFEVWKHCNDVKRKRVTVSEVNPIRVEFEERRTAWLIKSGYTSKRITKGQEAA